jgi:hypothetical protein
VTPQELKNAIFLLHTRRFGTVAEHMVKRIQGLEKGKNIFHDLYDQDKSQRVEVKFSTVRATLPPIDEDDIVASLEAEVNTVREISFSSWQDKKFTCNIQQIKKSEFEILYYGLFFDDCIQIFRIESDQIGEDIGYSDKQHKGNTGEGQFHITEKTLHCHLAKFRHRQLSYEDLLSLLHSSK